MEYVYYPIIDNITEIITIFRSFRHAFHVSSSAKYLAPNIFHICKIKLTRENQHLFCKLINVKNLRCRDCRLNFDILNLTKLQKLKIYHRPEYVDFGKLNQLTSLNLKFDTWLYTMFTIHHFNLKKLTLNYYHRSTNDNVIDCPKLITLNISCINSKQIFHVDTLNNLQSLTLNEADIDINNHAFPSLTYLHLDATYSHLYLTHLHNLMSLSISNMYHDVIVKNLSNLTNVCLLKCRSEVILSNLPKLKFLFLKEIEHVRILNLDMLFQVELRCKIKSAEKIKLFECESIKYLNINKYEYDKNVSNRMKQLTEEKRAIQGDCSFNKLADLSRLTHLIIIDKKKINNIIGADKLKSLCKLTIAYHDDTQVDYARKVLGRNKWTVRRTMTIKDALMKYGKYLVR